MGLLDMASIGSGLLGLIVCLYYIRDWRVATMTGLIFLSASELALHRVPWLADALIVVGFSFVSAGLVLKYRRPS